METIKLVLEIIGLITTAVSVLTFLGIVIGWLLGIAPLMYRLGLGRWSRKISVAAEGPAFSDLKADLVDSGVFKERNIAQVTQNTLSKVRESSLVLVDYASFSEAHLETILRNKGAQAGLIVYFPHASQTNKIPDHIIKLINNEPHTVLANFRGRLINDVLITLLSTSYKR